MSRFAAGMQSSSSLGGAAGAMAMLKRKTNRRMSIIESEQLRHLKTQQSKIRHTPKEKTKEVSVESISKSSSEEDDSNDSSSSDGAETESNGLEDDDLEKELGANPHHPLP